MTKREMEDRIVALEAQVRLLQGLIAMQRIPVLPPQTAPWTQPTWAQPTWAQPTWVKPIVTCGVAQ